MTSALWILVVACALLAARYRSAGGWRVTRGPVTPLDPSPPPRAVMAAHHTPTGIGSPVPAAGLVARWGER